MKTILSMLMGLAVIAGCDKEEKDEDTRLGRVETIDAIADEFGIDGPLKTRLRVSGAPELFSGDVREMRAYISAAQLREEQRLFPHIAKGEDLEAAKKWAVNEMDDRFRQRIQQTEQELLDQTNRLRAAEGKLRKQMTALKKERQAVAEIKQRYEQDRPTATIRLRVPEDAVVTINDHNTEVAGIVREYLCYVDNGYEYKYHVVARTNRGGREMIAENTVTLSAGGHKNLDFSRKEWSEVLLRWDEDEERYRRKTIPSSFEDEERDRRSTMLWTGLPAEPDLVPAAPIPDPSAHRTRRTEDKYDQPMLGIDAKQHGESMEIHRIFRKGLAARLGLERGDRIIQINDHPTNSVTCILNALHDSPRSPHYCRILIHNSRTNQQEWIACQL